MRAAICELGIEPAANDTASTAMGFTSISVVGNDPPRRSVPNAGPELACRAMTSADVMLDTTDGPMRAYVARPAGDAVGAVIVVQEAFGVNGHIEDVTRRLADAGYYVRKGPPPS